MAALVGGPPGLAAQEWEEAFESYLRYVGNYPHADTTAFSDGLNGVASNRKDAWFFTQTNKNCTGETLQSLDLWRIPFSVNLNIEDLTGYPVVWLDLLPIVGVDGFEHLGDLDFYDGYLVIPLEGPLAAVGFVREHPGSGMLEWLGWSRLNTTDGSWLAVHPVTGELYTAKTWEDIDELSVYTVNWAGLAGAPPSPARERTGIIDVSKRRDVSLDVRIQHSQGAAFTPSGRLLVVSTGGESSTEEQCAIHVFDTESWTRVAVSSQETGALFHYECHPGKCAACEESQGVEVVDLDYLGDTALQGQLHVIQSEWECATDDLYLHHYSGNIYVDGAASGQEDGTLGRPYNTLAEAIGLAWDGATIVLLPGTVVEPATVTVETIVRLTSPSGTTRLDGSGEITLRSGGEVSVLTGGQLKLR